MKTIRHISGTWALVSLPVIGVALTVHLWTGRSLEAQWTRQIGHTLGFVRTQLEDRKTRLHTVLDQVGAHMAADQDFAFKLLVEKAFKDPAIVNMAKSEAMTFGLDLLSIADARGKLLSCAHWPGSYGSNVSAKLELMRNPPDSAVLYKEKIKEEDVLSLQTIKDIRIGSVPLALCGGYRIRRSFLERISLSDRMVLVLIHGDKVLQSHPIGEFYHNGLLGPGAGEAFARIDLDSKPYLAGLTRIPVQGTDGHSQAELVAAIAEGPAGGIRTRFLWRSLLVGLALSLLVSLVLIGRRKN